MTIKNIPVRRLGIGLIYIFIGVMVSYLFRWSTQSYVDLFGETVTPMSKLLAWMVSLSMCLLFAFAANRLSLRLNSALLGLTIGLVLFSMLYIIGPGVRLGMTLYITSVSFPYNVNMLAVLLLPLLLGQALHRLEN